MEEPDIETAAGRVHWVFLQERSRQKKKLLQKDFAKAVGVSAQAVGQWFKSITQPSAENLFTVSQKYPYHLE